MNTNLRPLSPFQDFCVKFLGYVPSSYDDCMTYLECLIYTYNYLKNEIVPTVNTQNTVIQEMKDYIDNYFTNLDVQEEINNKLDQMALDGTLEEIISGYIQLKSLLTYDTVADMKNATNLVNGSFALTLGFNAKGDKGSAKYKIRTITNDDVIDEITIIELSDDTLIAELIPNDINNVKVFNDDIKIGIEKSKVLILNNETYNMTISNTIVKSHIKIYGNGATINTSSNVTYLFNLNYAELYNLSIIEENISDNTKNIIFTGNNFKFNNCSFESTSTYYKDALQNVEFYNCTFNSYYREIFMGSGKMNNLKVINCNFTRDQNYSSPYAGDSRILVYNIEGTTALTDTDLANHGNNIEIKNCVFNNTNKRQIHILNVYNVEIENNTFNASGLDSSVVGGSDDLVSIDFVYYFKINNNFFGESGENELDLLSAKYGEVKNNVMEKSYDSYAIDINWSDFVRSYGESITDRDLLKTKDVVIENNTINSHTYTFNITPSDNIHIYHNNITNNVSTNIIIFDDFGTLTPATKSNLTVTNLDVGTNNVKTSLGDFGKIYVRDTYDYVITNDSGHLSPDICCFVSQNATASTLTYTTNGFPCKHGEAGKAIALDGSFRSVTPSLVRWQNSQAVRRGIDFIGNRYNNTYWNSIFYTGDYLDKYPLGQDEQDNGSYNGTQTSGTIMFKSW